MRTDTQTEPRASRRRPERLIIVLLLTAAGILPAPRLLAEAPPPPTECTPGENDCLPTREQCATGNYNGFWDGGDDDRFATCLGRDGVVIAYLAGSFLSGCGDAAVAGVGAPTGVDPNTCSTPAAQAGLVPNAQSIGLNECADDVWGDEEKETDVWDPPGDRSLAHTRCTGELISHDGVELDARLIVPTGAAGPLPTVTILHGWNGNRIWIPPTQTLPFVAKGYAVLVYTARGFHGSCGFLDPAADLDTAGGTNPLEEENPAACARGWTHVAERDWEVKDAQHILGLLVDAGIADPGRLGAVGASYGAAQVWMLATSLPWATPSGAHTIQLAAAVPGWGWTDLLNSLAPSGRASDRPGGLAGPRRPFGVMKQSWVNSFLAAGRVPLYTVGQDASGIVWSLLAPRTWGQFNVADPTERHSHVDSWTAILNAGEPYDTPANWLPDAFRGKSAIYADDYFGALRRKTARAVPIFALQGWNDTLFPAVESLQMYRELKAAEPTYPITVGLLDWGHGFSGSTAQLAEVEKRSHAFLDRQLLSTDRRASETGAFSFATQCEYGADYVPSAVEGRSWDALSTKVLTVRSEVAGTTRSAPPAADDTQADPIHYNFDAPFQSFLHRTSAGAVGSPRNGCAIVDATAATPGSAAWRWPVGRSTTLLGLPEVTVGYDLDGVDATVIAKVWDVAPNGTEKTLVTRGVYRLSTLTGDSTTGKLAFQLFGNHWEFRAGHTIELELSQTDAPFLRPDNLPSTLRVSDVQLSLPEARPEP